MIASHLFRPPTLVMPQPVHVLATSRDPVPLGDPIRAATQMVEPSLEVYPLSTRGPLELQRVWPPKRLATSVDPVPRGDPVRTLALMLERSTEAYPPSPGSKEWLLRDLIVPAGIDRVPLGTVLIDQAQNLTQVVYTPPQLSADMAAWRLVRRLLPQTFVPPAGPPLGPPVLALLNALTALVYPAPQLGPLTTWLLRDTILPAGVDPVPSGIPWAAQRQAFAPQPELPAPFMIWLLRDLMLPQTPAVAPALLNSPVLAALAAMAGYPSGSFTMFVGRETALPVSVDPVPLGDPWGAQTRGMTPLAYAPASMPAWLAAWLLRDLLPPVSADPVPLGNVIAAQTSSATAGLYGPAQLSTAVLTWLLRELVLPQTPPVIGPPPLGAPWLALENALTAMLYPASALGVLGTWLAQQRRLPVSVDAVPLGDPLRALAQGLTVQLYPPGVTPLAWAWIQRILPVIMTIPIGNPWAMLELLVSTMLYPPPGPPEARRFIPRLLPISSERPPLGNPEAALLNALTAFLYPLATRPFGEPVSVILPATPPFISGGPVFIVPVRLLDFLVPKKEGTS